MQYLLSSASRMVFLLMTIAVIVLTVMGIMDAKDFMVLASMTFAYYFTKAPVPDSSTTTSTTNTTGTSTEK